MSDIRYSVLGVGAGVEVGVPEERMSDSSDGLVVVMVTASGSEEAERIADALLDARLAACVNLVRDVRSFYWWQGEREASDEVLLMAKTRAALFPRLTQVVREHHSYEVFEALAIPVAACSPDYAAWVLENTVSDAERG